MTFSIGSNVNKGDASKRDQNNRGKSTTKVELQDAWTTTETTKLVHLFLSDDVPQSETEYALNLLNTSIPKV